MGDSGTESSSPSLFQSLSPVGAHDVYRERNSARLVAIKVGFCWPAFFFQAFWALRHRLWPQFFGFWFATAGYKLFSRTMAADEPVIGSVVLLVWYAVMAGVGGLFGNEWRASKLTSEGFVFEARVPEASSPNGAVALFRGMGAARDSEA